MFALRDSADSASSARMTRKGPFLKLAHFS
jgi:hypothetical protein